MNWIPITEGYPEDYQSVLVSFYENEYFYAINVAIYINGEWYLRLCEAPISLPINAWMPLPEPYKGE